MFLYDISFFILGFLSLITILGLINNLYRKRVNAYFFVLPVFLSFYVFPIFIDKIIGLNYLGPNYSTTIYYALNDNLTSLIYNFYISVVLLVFYYFSRSKVFLNYSITEKEVIKIFNFIKKWRFFIYLIIVSPLFLVLVAGDYSFYSTYADRDRMLANNFQASASKMSVISLPLIVLLINEKIFFFKKNKNIIYILSLFLLFLILSLNIYVHGKRSVVAAFIFLFIVSLLITKVLKKRFIVLLGFISFLIFSVFLLLYGKNIEGVQGFLGIYEGLRVDFSRDYSLKFVIYHELINDNSVVPYAGASYLFLLTFFIPRELWDDKPLPYAVYFTNSIFGDFGGTHFYGWGLTTSFVSEAVSNIGFMGLIFFPIFYIFSIKKIENKKNIILKMLGYLIMVLLLVLEPIAIMFLIAAYFLLDFFTKYKFKF